MMYQLFGGKAAKPADKLETVRPNIYEISSDDWELDANSALSVSLMGKTQTKAVFSLQSLSDDIRLKKLGIYSKSAKFSAILVDQLCTPEIDVFNFNADKEYKEFYLNQANSMDAWLIHMDDEDESPWLDSVLDFGAEKSSMFLFEQKLTKQCLHKIGEFMLESKLMH